MTVDAQEKCPVLIQTVSQASFLSFLSNDLRKADWGKGLFNGDPSQEDRSYN